MARYFRRGVSRVIFAPAIADTAAPTETELDDGVELTEPIAAINGFQFTNSPIATPDLASSFTKSIPGEDTTDTPSLDLYDDDTSTEIRDALAKGTAGFMVLMPYGWDEAGGDRCEVWPVTSTGVNDQWTTDNNAAMTSAQFAVTGVPEQDAATPTVTP